MNDAIRALTEFQERFFESIIIKNKKDLKAKLQKGLDDIKANKVYSLDEVFTKIDNI